MNRGYIKVWRKIIEAGWLQNHKLCAFWLWCLLKASHKEYDLVVGCQQVHLMPGSFVFGRKAASKELRMSEQQIRTLLDFLKTSQNITIKTTNKFSIISIVNWDIYQTEENEINQQSNQPLTNNQPTTNHKQECKEYKNINNNIYSDDFLKFYSLYPNKKEKPAAYKSWQKLSKTRPPLQTILDAIQKQIDWRKNANGAFRPEWKNPATWLNKGCWDDECKEGGNYGTGTVKKRIWSERDAINSEAGDLAEIAARKFTDKLKAAAGDT
jgi:hypothetical protein